MARSTIAATRTAHDAARMGRNAATSPWSIGLARFGYAAKGVVYLIIGGLAAKAAVGAGGTTTDRNGALRALYEQPFGKFLLAIVAVGLIAYALWSIVRAIVDPEGTGSDGKGIATRLGYTAVGLSYAALSAAAIQLVMGTGNGGKSSDATTQDWTAHLLTLPFGPFLVVMVGLVVIGVACYVFRKAYKADFQHELDLAAVSARIRKVTINVGRFGYAALGVVFTIVGIFLVVAAARHRAGQAKGLGGALAELAHQPYGHVLLAVVALGLVAYGAYSFVQARYRRFSAA